MKNHQGWIERAERYALGALDGDELIQFQEHLAVGCPDCERCLREMGETLTLLPKSLALETPPGHIKSRLLDQIAGEDGRSAQARPRSRQLGWSLGAAVFPGEVWFRIGGLESMDAGRIHNERLQRSESS